LAHKGKKIMLIAHSMGSIIAYDVLYELKKEIEIETFVTIGSPLGLPMIISKFFEEHQIEYDSSTKRPTPEGLKSWYNFADIDDGIASNDDLSNEFAPNSAGVSPIDSNIYNDYKNWKTKNAHKSFGYLRTQEISKVVFDFLKRTPFWKF
jgi:predicted alpha/beta hydrolase family esterase